eukprot:565373-Pelagomonas_calceolata.AAC.4
MGRQACMRGGLLWRLRGAAVRTQGGGVVGGCNAGVAAGRCCRALGATATAAAAGAAVVGVLGFRGGWRCRGSALHGCALGREALRGKQRALA